jgi:hypothetical protein
MEDLSNAGRSTEVAEAIVEFHDFFRLDLLLRSQFDEDPASWVPLQQSHPAVDSV